MAKNVGKVFEEDFKNSIPDYCFYHRLTDSTGGFGGGAKLRFTTKNPCDCIIFDTDRRFLYALELKTTEQKYFNFEPLEGEVKSSKMIHQHQIKGLLELSKYKNIVSGFILNFREPTTKSQKTYFIHIKDFIAMITTLDKKSFNQNDLLKYNPIEISGRIKKVHFSWDIDTFFKNY